VDPLARAVFFNQGEIKMKLSAAAGFYMKNGSTGVLSVHPSATAVGLEIGQPRAAVLHLHALKGTGISERYGTAHP
jgi:hypothetical protein